MGSACRKKPPAGAGRILYAVFAIALAILASPATAGSGATVADGFARPALAAFEEAGAKLAGAAQALCATPGDEPLNAVRARFGETVRAFGRASVLRFGPLAAENRFERLFFWPDPRGAALRQVQAALARQDEGLTDAAQLKGKSVALQGLPALEFVLFGTGSDALAQAPSDFRCRFAAALAQNVAAIAGELSQGWASGAPFSRSFTDPTSGSEPYRSAAEVDGEIVKALATVLQFTRSAEILPPLGESAEKANGRRAPLWRSDLTFPLIAARIDGARGLLRAAGYSGSLPAEMNWVPDQIDFQLQAAAASLGAVSRPAELAFADAEDRRRIAFANVTLDGAGHDISEKLAAALGLVMGFNALDGD